MRIFKAYSLWPLTIFLLLTSWSAVADVHLNIPPTKQKTSNWCWLAVGEMVFTYYGEPNANCDGNYQCGIVGILAGSDDACWNDCSLCEMNAGNFRPPLDWRQTMMGMLMRYPREAATFTRRKAKDLKVELSGHPLSPHALITELDARRPVIAGVSPDKAEFDSDGITQHVVLIVGYERPRSKLVLIVNDSARYEPANDPYLAARGKPYGKHRYKIEYEAFKQGLLWMETFYGLEPRTNGRRHKAAHYCPIEH